MNREHQKVTAGHLARKACLYVRQSTLRQVVENSESTRRQYELRSRAMALGWPSESIAVIDSDLGQSGADRDRAGFKQLVAEVGVGNVGIVLGLEVSRLARNSSDWHRLLELCAMTGALILDEDGLYDPGSFNDRLLLGMKGQMSEAELHILKARLQGGIRSRARRGELKVPLPIGLAYDPLDRVVLDPDGQVRASVAMLFDTFERTGAASATVKAFRREGLKFPRRLRGGPDKGELRWVELELSRVLQILHNPRYAGAFAFGRRRCRRLPAGGASHDWVPLDEIEVLLRDHHPGYISWERFEANRRQLADNAARAGIRRRPAREGPALLQGLAICGRCGSSMTVRYHLRPGGEVPDYMCQSRSINRGAPACQQVPGRSIDEAVGDLLVGLMTPASLEAALQVQKEIEQQVEKIDAWHDQRLQRARQEADLARRRFMNACPDNRIVADVLESEWNQRLRILDEVQQDCDRRRAEDRRALEDGQRRRILDLAGDFPKLWRDPETPARERKRMVRLLVEDVTVTRDGAGGTAELGIRLRGGAVRRIAVPLDLPPWQRYATPPAVVAEIDELLEDHCEAAIADILNRRGRRTGYGKPFSRSRVLRVRREFGLDTRRQRLRRRGLLTGEELAERLGIKASTLKKWRQKGLIAGTPYNDRNECLFEMPDNPPVKHMKRSAGRPAPPPQAPEQAGP